MKTLYQEIASRIQAYNNCIKSGNTEWEHKHLDVLTKLESHLPSGSGFDSGTQIDVDRSNDKRIILTTSFHHMDEYGGYDGWTEHEIWITPSFQGIDLRITGRDLNEFKDYCYQTFEYCLTRPVEISFQDDQFNVTVDWS
jgi:hypothetical protein